VLDVTERHGALAIDDYVDDHIVKEPRVMLFVLGDGDTGRLKGTAGGDLVNTVSAYRMWDEYHARPLIHEIDCSQQEREAFSQPKVVSIPFQPDLRHLRRESAAEALDIVLGSPASGRANCDIFSTSARNSDMDTSAHRAAWYSRRYAEESFPLCLEYRPFHYELHRSSPVTNLFRQSDETIFLRFSCQHARYARSYANT
jgi:hypothetical protein